MTAALATALSVPPTHLLAQPEADPSWGDEETADETSEEVEPAEDIDTAGEVDSAEDIDTAGAVQPATPIATAPVDPIAPKTVEDIKIPEQKGLGMMIAAGGLGAVGWGVMGWRIARIRSRCTADAVDVMSVSEEDAQMLFDSAVDCFSARGENAGLWALQALPNAANWGIAPGAAAIRAKYDAARSAKTGEVDRKPGVFIGTGAGLLAAGVVGRVVVAVYQVQALNPTKSVFARCIDGSSVDTEEFFDCYRGNVSTRYAMHQLSSAAVAGGAGLLAYGVVYKRERKNYEKNFGAQPATALEFSVAPQLALNYTGVSAQLRW